ncbi:hypothetical protein SAMN04489798_3325 [Pseudomonas arsenicoxydans]|uniref:Uncharacterized protein n=1 Tax=Pseudomonas arsenicoxydans TaxID=702115 RepID=A0A1H0KRE7_9PSED|nr:hypothetical protein SAMN04489798_3325 [Pseudomonas arsenicoxydans]
MNGERGGENTSDAPVIHYCDGWIVFGRQDAGEGGEKLSKTTAIYLGFIGPNCCVLVFKFWTVAG